MTPQEELAALRRLAELEAKAGGGQPKADGRSFLTRSREYSDGLQRAAIDGLTFGMADEIAAGARTLGAYLVRMTTGRTDVKGQDYGAALADERTKQAAFADQNPVASTVANVAGGFANPLMRALLTGAGMGMGRQAVTGAAVGAGTGAAYGFGEGEGGLAERAGEAASGAVVGGAIGGAAPPVISGISRGMQWAADQTIARLSPGMQANAAARKAAEALARDGLTPDQAAARLAEIGPEAVLMDVGKNTRAMGAAVARAPGRGASEIDAMLTARQEGTRDAATGALQGGQFGRVTGLVDSIVPENFATAKQGTVDARRALGAGYNAAREAGETVDVAPILKSLDGEIGLSKGSIRTGLERIKSFLTDADGKPETTIATLHQAKMAIDDLMGSGEARNSMGNVARARIRDYQQQLVDAIESAGEAGKQYKAARLGTAGQWRIDEALDAGRSFMGKGEMPDVSKLTAEELDAFRTGAAEAIREKIAGTTVRADVTKKLYEIPGLEDKIRKAFGDDARFKAYVQGLQGERAMFDSYAAVRGGSQTAERQAADAALQRDPGMTAEGIAGIAANPANPVNYLRAAVGAVRQTKDRLATPEPVRNRIADMLMRRDPQALLNDAFKSNQMSAAQRAALARALMIGSTSGN